MKELHGPFLSVQRAAPSTPALRLIQGESQRPTAEVGFGVGKLDREMKRLPPGVFLVTTSRPRPPYVLDLVLYANPDLAWRRS